MQFENVSIEYLMSNYKDFSVEGFNIFAKGIDNLPHLICTCPNKDMARGIQSLLTIAKKAQIIHVVNAYITSNCYLSQKFSQTGLWAWLLQ